MRSRPGTGCLPIITTDEADLTSTVTERSCGTLSGKIGCHSAPESDTPGGRATGGIRHRDLHKLWGE